MMYYIAMAALAAAVIAHGVVLGRKIDTSK